MVTDLLNPWIRSLVPYSSARSEFSGSAKIFLDANESWKGGNDGINRYPDPKQHKLRKAIETVMGFPYEMTAIGNGSDEVIDMLIRMFCAPGKDSIMIERPTYGTYSVFAETSNVSVIDIPLRSDLSLDADGVIRGIEDKKPKIVFICSPNNPTGRVYPLEEIVRIADANPGITVVDEAYADFAENFESAASAIKNNDRIVVLRTLSKAYGIAGARIGILIADPEVQKVFMKAKAPYNVSKLAEETALEAVSSYASVRDMVAMTIERRKRFSEYLKMLPYVKEVFPSDANFVLFRVPDAASLYKYLLEKGIVVRNRSFDPMLENTIRVTIGSESEMAALKEALDGWTE